MASNPVNDVALCPRCAGLGWYYRNLPVTDPDHGKAFRCECQREADNARRLQAVMTASNLTPEMCADMTFASFDASRHTSALQASQQFADNPRGWLVFFGKPGNGKTHLMVAITQTLAAHGRSPLYVVAPDVLRYLRKGIADGSADDRLDMLREVDVLLLDDLGAEQTTEWAMTQLYDMLDYRYRAKLPTVIASNLSIAQWAFRLQSRARDTRLSRVIGFGGSDFRLTDEHGENA